MRRAMLSLSSFVAPYRAEPRPPARLEYVLAVARAFLTVSCLVAIWLDPTEPARLATITYAVLIGYAAYSLVVLAVVRRASSVSRVHTRVLHTLDIAWGGVLTFVSDGPISPFFLFFLFVALAAAYRWGLRETMATMAVTLALFFVQIAAALVGPWQTLVLGNEQFQLNRAIIRLCYLLITGGLTGYLAEQEKAFRGEMAAIADAMQQARVEIGLDGSVTALGRLLLRLFGATAADIILHERGTERAFRWQITPGAADAATERSELPPGTERTWLFDDGASTWHASSPAEGTRLRARAVNPYAWSLRSFSVMLPPTLTLPRCSSVTVTNVGLDGEWRGRIFLYDIADSPGLERSLHFLDS